MKILKFELYIVVILLIATTIFSCENEGVPDIGDLPPIPQISISAIDTNNNYRVELLNSNDYFNHLISAPLGKFRNPVVFTDKTTSNRTIDTVQFINMGTVTITIHGLSKEGGGNSVATETLEVPKDLGAQCTPILEMLVGDCLSESGKCWTWPQIPNELIVGPIPASGEWFTSNGLVPEQYDDKFCFIFENSQYIYDNYGASVNPWNGFAAEEYSPPSWTFQLFEGEPIFETEHTLVLVPNETELGKPWAGTWDSGPIYGIVEISEDKLVLRSAITDADGVEGDGFFEYVLIPGN